MNRLFIRAIFIILFCLFLNCATTDQISTLSLETKPDLKPSPNRLQYKIWLPKIVQNINDMTYNGKELIYLFNYNKIYRINKTTGSLEGQNLLLKPAEFIEYSKDTYYCSCSNREIGNMRSERDGRDFSRYSNKPSYIDDKKVYTFPLHHNMKDLTWDGTFTWYTCAYHEKSLVICYDLNSETNIKKFELKFEPTYIQYIEGDLWVTDSNNPTISEVSYLDGSIRETYTLPEQPQGIAWDGELLWVAGVHKVYGIDLFNKRELPKEVATCDDAIQIDLPKNTQMSNPDAYAIIIGNQNYENTQQLRPVDYAQNDAKAVRNYLTKILGYKGSRIDLLLDVNLKQLETIFGDSKGAGGYLKNRLQPNESDLFIYYSGHGAPDINSKLSYIVPVDGNIYDIPNTCYSIKSLYNNLAKLPLRKLIIVFDACFSGYSGDGTQVVKHISPVRLELEQVIPTSSYDWAIYHSASADQPISSWYPAKQHGLFTYFFLKALNGYADLDQNKKLTLGEIEDFVINRAQGVPNCAWALYKREQMPVLKASNPSVKEQILVRY